MVAFLDADDVWHPRKLELQARIFAEDPSLGLLGTGAFDWPMAAFPEVGPDQSGPVVPVTWCQLAVKNYLTTSSVVARHEILDEAGPFDTRMQGPEDRDLWLRVAEISRIANLDKPLTGYRKVPGSVSRQSAICQEGMLRILSKLDDQNAWRGDHLLRRRAYAYVHHSCSYNYSVEGEYSIALLNLMKSFAWYPFPFRQSEVRTRLERPKRLVNIALRMLRLRGQEPTPRYLLEAGELDALEAAKFTMESLIPSHGQTPRD